MAVKSSGSLALWGDIGTQLCSLTPVSVGKYSSVTDGLPANPTTGTPVRFSDFYSKSAPCSAPIYSGSTTVVTAYFSSVDRNVYWAIDIKTLANRFTSNVSDFIFDYISYTNPNMQPIAQPSLYSSIAIDVSGSIGRSFCAVTQQPSAANNWIGIVTADDNGASSRGPYYLTINLTATPITGASADVVAWFNKTVVNLDETGTGTGRYSTTLSLITHAKATLSNITWSGAAGLTLTNVNSTTVTITNNNAFSNGVGYDGYNSFNIYWSRIYVNYTITFGGVSSSKSSYLEIVGKVGVDYGGGGGA